MIGAAKKFLIALAVLGGMIIALHFMLHQLQRVGGPLGSLASRADSLVNGH